MENKSIQETSCEDVQFLLRNLRVVDDRIIYGLNLATPTPSFRSQIDPAKQCELLFNELAENYKQRGALLERCLATSTHKISELRSQNTADSVISHKLKAEKAKARELRNEIGIEEILRDRARKVFTERCYPFYRGYEGW